MRALAVRAWPEVLAAVLILVFSRVYNLDDGRVYPVVLDVLICASAALTRVRPTLATVLVGLALGLWNIVPPPDLGVLAALIPIYVTGALGLSRLRLAAATAYLPLATYPIATYPGTDLAGVTQIVILALAFGASAWHLGTFVREQQARLGRLRADREAAIRSERLTIARDLHDAVASSNTHIIMRVEKMNLRGVADPEDQSDIDYVLATARQSSLDLRRMLAALRSTEDGSAPAGSGWTITSLRRAAEDALTELERSGFVVHSNVGVEDELLDSTAVDTAGKVLREAVSNIVKHADRAGPVQLLLDQNSSQLEIVAVNRIGSPVPGPGNGHGLGLLGAEERVLAVGGDFEVVSTDSEWVVRAQIPI